MSVSLDVPHPRQSLRQFVGAGIFILVLGVFAAVMPVANAQSSSPVRIVTVRADSGTALTVTWSSRSKGLVHRVLTAQRSTMELSNVVSSRARAVRVTGLTPGQRYYVQVVAVRGNKAVRATMSRKVSVTTPPDRVVVESPRPSSVPTQEAPVSGSSQPSSVSAGAPATVAAKPSSAPTAAPSPVSDQPAMAPQVTQDPSVATGTSASFVQIPWSAWTRPLRPDQPLQGDPALNGTQSAQTPYATRLANQAGYHTTSTPVQGAFYKGYGAVIGANTAATFRVRTRDLPALRRVYIVPNGSTNPVSMDWAWGLPKHFVSVPVPSGPNGERFADYYKRDLAGSGTDKHLTIYNEDTGELWEMWNFRWNAQAGRYETAYGGYVKDVRSAPMAFPYQWGGRATSLPIALGVMSQAEYAAGSFNHPLFLSIPVVKRGFMSPATREDGFMEPAVPSKDARDAVPEGAWFRLPASYPIDTSKPKLWQMIVRAARDYGLVVADRSGGALMMSAESAVAVGTPYSDLTTPALPRVWEDGKTPYYGSANVLNTFPWRDLVQIQPLG